MNSLLALANRYLWFSTVDRFNDPFELAFRTSDSIVTPEEKARADLISMFGVCCFFERLEPILYWSHYASSHTGFCLEFDTTKFSFDDEDLGGFHPVDYDPAAPKFPSGGLNLHDPNVLQQFELAMHRIFHTKGPEWEYEKSE